jgi:hypothetical protein
MTFLILKANKLMAAFVNGVPSPSIPSRQPTYNPMDPVDLSPYTIGEYTIIRQHLLRCPHIRYLIMKGREVLDTQVSKPDASDCLGADRRHSHGIRSAKVVLDYVPPSEEGTVTSRIIAACVDGWITTSQIRKNVRHTDRTISPILTRLHQAGQLERKGRAGAYQYRAVEVAAEAA